MIEQGFRDLLAGDATVNTLTGGRVRPLAGAQLDKRPFLTIYNSGGADSGENATFTGAREYRKSIIEIAVIADSFSDCASLSTEVRRVLHGIAATTSTVRIAPSLFEDETDITQATVPGSELPAFVRTQQYRVNYKPL